MEGILELFTGLMGGSMGAFALQAIGKTLVSQLAKKRRARKNKNPHTIVTPFPVVFGPPEEVPVAGSISEPQPSFLSLLHNDDAGLRNFSGTDFESCQSCGLQGPPALLTEHLERSPSHKKRVQENPISIHALAAPVETKMLAETVPSHPPVGNPTAEPPPSFLSILHNDDAGLRSFSGSDFESCISCGLEGPPALLIEHLERCPSHKKRVEVNPISTHAVAAPVEMKVVAASVPLRPQDSFASPPPDPLREVILEEKARTDHSERAIRTLLQLLVPPRAFGHRTRGRESSALAGVLPVGHDFVAETSDIPSN